MECIRLKGKTHQFYISKLNTIPNTRYYTSRGITLLLLFYWNCFIINNWYNRKKELISTY